MREGALIARKYRVEGILGHGGMGVIVAAFHRKIGSRVAIKILYPSSAAEPEAVARFLREARAAAALQSEHVVRILDFGRNTDGLPFMVMEHLVGINLSDLLDSRGPLPVDEALNYVMQASEAVAEAHARGIVHRDIKPANLFLTTRSDGAPHIKVLDFGISKADCLDGSVDPSLTATTDTLGSPLYMSPEQVRNTKSVTGRTDIWALGVVLYELLAGTPPFFADSLPALSVMIAADPPVPLSRYRTDLPQGLERAIMACLDKDPMGRPGSVGQLARLLSPFAAKATEGWVERTARIVAQAGLPQRESVRPVLPSIAEEVPWSWQVRDALRRNVKAGLVGLAFCAFAAVAAGGIWWGVAERKPPTAQAGVTSAAATSAIVAANVPTPVASESASVKAQPAASTAGTALEAQDKPSSPDVVSSADGARHRTPGRPRTGVPRTDPLADRY